MAGKKRGRPPGSGKKQRAVRGLATIPTSKLRAELDRRSQALGHLQQQRDRLMAAIGEIDRTLADFGAAPTGGAMRRRGPGRPPGKAAAPGTRRRARNEMNLVEALAQTLKGKTMGVSEVSEEVQKNGYKTTSPNFRTIVNQALISNPKVFKKIARGQYTAK